MQPGVVGHQQRQPSCPPASTNDEGFGWWPCTSGAWMRPVSTSRASRRSGLTASPSTMRSSLSWSWRHIRRCLDSAAATRTEGRLGVWEAVTLSRTSRQQAHRSAVAGHGTSRQQAHRSAVARHRTSRQQAHRSAIGVGGPGVAGDRRPPTEGRAGLVGRFAGPALFSHRGPNVRE